MDRSTESQIQPGPVCGVCPLFHSCNAICEPVEALLPSMERGRVDSEDLPRLHMGVRLTNALLDSEEILTERQRIVVQLYYREDCMQKEIAERLGITQQAVMDSLKRARLAVGKHMKGLLAEALSPATTATARGRNANVNSATTRRR